MLLFMFSSGDSARAVPFNPAYPTFLSDPTPSANANITNVFDLKAPDSFPLGGTFGHIATPFLDTDLDNTTGRGGADVGAGIPNGSVTGVLLSIVNFGVPALGANACFVPAPLPFHLVAANSDPFDATPVPGSSNALPTNVWSGYRDGPGNGGFEAAANGLPDAVDSWPAMLDGELAVAGVAKTDVVARSYSQLNIVGTVVPLHFLIYAPGSVPGLPASLGYISQSVLQHPSAPPAPSAIGDTCTDPAGPFTVTTTMGVTIGEPISFPLPPCSPSSCGAPGIAGTMFHPAFPPNLPFGEVCDGNDNDGDTIVDEGCGFLNRQNPAVAGSYLMSITSDSDRDTDNDGFENSIDHCPLIVDAESSGIFAPFDPAGFVYPPGGVGYNPRWPGPQPQDLEFDGLAGSVAIPSCDPIPFVPSPVVNAQSDQDTDFFSNLQDNCVNIPNFFQTQQELILAVNPSDGGQLTDTMGDPCDPNPKISDGHHHQFLTPWSVCVGLADSDFDGYCDADEVALGSNPGDPFSRPEDASGLAPGLLTLGVVCSDGIDNDGVGGTDLADSKCQLPAHDIELRAKPGLVGPRNVRPCISPDRLFSFQVRNNEATVESVEMAVLVDPLSGYGGAHVIEIFGNAVVSTDLGQGDHHDTILTPPEPDHDPHTLIGQTNTDTGGFPGPAGPIGSTATDLEPEGFGLATLSLKDNGTTTVHIRVHFDPSPEPTTQTEDPAVCETEQGPPDVTASDYNMTVDVCHTGDPNPLGLFGTGACSGSPVRGHPVVNDGGQDRVNTANDASISKLINDLNQ